MRTLGRFCRLASIPGNPSGIGFETKLWRVSLLLAMVTLPAAAQTTIPGGTIALDTVWDLAGSPYVITGNLTIAGTDGADAVTSLTIEPGVEVRVNTNVQLQVGGFAGPARLIADGDIGPGAPATIRFTSDAPTPDAGDWRRIFIDGDSAGSVLRNVVVEYAGRNAFDGGAVNVSHTTGSVTLERITIRQSAIDGLLLNSGAFSLTACDIRQNGEFSIQIDNSATLVGSVTDCDLESLFYAGGNPDVGWSGNRFHDWGAATSRAEADVVGSLLNENTIVSSSPQPVLEVANFTNVDRDATWSTEGGTIRLLGSINVRGTDGGDGVTTLILDPGSRIEFAPGNAQLSVGAFSSAGALIADGDSGPGAPAPIIFTSSSSTPARGDWRRIYLDRGSSATSRLRNVRIEYGGRNANEGALQIFQNAGPVILDQLTIVDSAQFGFKANASFELTSCSITDTELHGIALDPLAGLVATVSDCVLESVRYAGPQPDVRWENNTFNGWGTLISQVSPDAVGDLTTQNTLISSVIPLRTRVTNGTVSRDQTWGAEAGILEMTGALTVGGTDGADGITTLTLQPGLRIEFPPSAQFAVGQFFPPLPGVLVADGNNGPGAPQQISFTSTAESPAPGDWFGLAFGTNSAPGSVLRNVRIEYAGQGALGAGISIAGNNLVTLDQIEVEHIDNVGIEFITGAFTLSDSTIRNTNGYGLTFGGNPTVAGTVSNSVLESFFYEDNDPEVAWTNNTFENWGALTSRADITDVGVLSTQNTFNAVGGAVLEVEQDTLFIDSRWTAAPGPYVFDFGFVVRGLDGPDSLTTLTLDPGVEIRLPLGEELSVGSVGQGGQLIADGRTGPGTFDTILISSAEVTPQSGQTAGVYVRGTGRASLYHTAIKFADTALRVEGTLDAVEQLTVFQSATGVWFDDGATLGESTLTGLKTSEVGVGLSVGGMDLTIRGSDLNASSLAIENRTPGASCVDAALNWWGDPTGPSGVTPTQGCENDTPNGNGSMITDGVLFDNFLGEPANTDEGSEVGDVPDLRFVDDVTLVWGPVAHAVEYHIYRQDLTALAATPFAVCRNDLDANRTDSSLTDLELPLPGEGWTYLVGAKDCFGVAGTLGTGENDEERQPLVPCP